MVTTQALATASSSSQPSGNFSNSTGVSIFGDLPVLHPNRDSPRKASPPGSVSQEKTQKGCLGRRPCRQNAGSEGRPKKNPPGDTECFLSFVLKIKTNVSGATQATARAAARQLRGQRACLRAQRGDSRPRWGESRCEPRLQMWPPPRELRAGRSPRLTWLLLGSYVERGAATGPVTVTPRGKQKGTP